MNPCLPPTSATAPRRARGFTLTELLVVLAVGSIVAAVAIGSFVSAKRKGRLAQCRANLHRVASAILSYGADHQGLPAIAPGQTGDLWWWYKEQVKSYAGLSGASGPNDTVFACPDDRGYSDPQPFHASPRFDYGSYVFNGVTLPGAPNIAGWELASIRDPRKMLLVMEWTAHAPLSWHKSKTGRKNMPFYCDAQSIVGFVDGHVSFSKIYYDGYNAAYTQDPIPPYDYQYSAN